MAIVYKARDVILNRYVAVKVLRDEFTTDEEFIKRFETEAQSAARLTHSNIVSIFDVGVDEGTYYIVMELIQGKTLKEIIIEEKGPLPWKWSINVAIQIASALDMAHKNNIIHRDIKPHNIIITEDGIAKVTDFGIAKAVSNSTITAFGTTIGSVHYFSPEHARGGYTDAKSDIYSLGVVMYEMLTGRVPFDADTPVSVALKHMQEEPIPPIEVNPNIPEVINKIIVKTLKKEPMLRYQTSMELLLDLKQALKNPEGDFVDVENYDKTAKTLKVATDRYGKVQDENEEQDNVSKFKMFIQNHKKLSIFLGVVILFFLAFGGTTAFLRITNPKEIDLPNVVGAEKQEAEQKITDAKLKFEVEKEEYNKDVPEGHVISQDPPYSDKYHSVKQGSTVKVIISKGAEVAVVPKVVGKKEEEAIEELEKAKLKAEVVKETSKTVEEGYVISQEVEENQEAYAGDTVKIHVSSGTGIKQVTVSSVVGKTEAQAQSELAALGLKVTVANEENTSKENGIVLKQSIEAGTTVDQGTAITITVNKIQELKTAPITVNVKSLLGGKVEYETDSSSDANSTEANKKVKKVELVVRVGEDIIFTDKVDPTQTNISAGSAKGTGVANIKVYIDGVLKNQGQIRFSESNPSYIAE